MAAASRGRARGGRFRRCLAGFACALAGAASGCGGPPDSPTTAAKAARDQTDTRTIANADESGDGSSAGATPSAPTPTGIDALTAWLDPAASAASFSRGDRGLDPAVVATIYALPPRASELLEIEGRIDEGLAASLGADASAGLLRPESLLFRPSVSVGIYALRPLAVARADFEAALERAGMVGREIEGFRVYAPHGAFPWKIVILDEGVVGFIPVAEVGSGLPPLTAGRDLPASELELEITKFLREDPGVFLTLHAAGPMLHYDTDARIAMVQFALRADERAIVGQVVLQPLGDVDETANQLEARRHPEENQQVQHLIASVAFVREAEVVVGKLEIGPEQLKHVER